MKTHHKHDNILAQQFKILHTIAERIQHIDYYVVCSQKLRMLEK